jgi:hypothetical protein
VVPVTPRRWVALLALLVLALAGLFLSGCTLTSERSLSNTERTMIEEQRPLPDGGFVKRTTEYIDGEKTSETTTKADLDWGTAAAKAGAAALTGDWGTLGGVAGTMLAAAGMGYVQHRRTRDHKADAEEGWAKYEAELKAKSHVG